MDLKIIKTSEYKALSIEETLKGLQTSEVGLKDADVSERQKIFWL
jgi:hypothetical protein